MEVGRLASGCLGNVHRQGTCPLGGQHREPKKVRRNSTNNLRTYATLDQTPARVTEKLQPDWTGDMLMSRMVNAAISNKQVYGVMKAVARQVMQSTAEKAGIPWRDIVKQYENTPEVFQIKEEIEDKSMVYPAYYTQPFHAYDEGNLNWLAAFEVESATGSMALRTFKGMEPRAAQDRLRGNIHARIQEFQKDVNARPVEALLDVGCSVGVSTIYLAHAYPAAHVTGLDLSPHFLAVAEYKERHAQLEQRKRIKYVHACAEATGMPDASFDLVTSNFVIHECPPSAIDDMIKEAFRLVSPGGVYAITDNDPRSATIQNLPPVIASLMKSTEPWSDVYYAHDVEAAMRDAGFANVHTRVADHRHRTILGFRPR